MWTLINTLQYFRYILLINIKFSKSIAILSQYLAVVVGEIQELENVFPDILNEYVINQNDIHEGSVIYPSFVNGGYSSPFLTDLNGRKVIMIFTITTITMVLLFIGMKVMKNVKHIGKRLRKNWQELFWNAPIRSLIELYFEL